MESPLSQAATNPLSPESVMALQGLGDPAMPPPAPPPAIDLRSAAAALAQAQQQRVLACAEEVKQVFSRYNCRPCVIQTYVDGQPQPPQIQIMPLDNPSMT